MSTTLKAIAGMGEDELATLMSLTPDEDFVGELLADEDQQQIDKDCQKHMSEVYEKTKEIPPFETWLKVRAHYIIDLVRRKYSADDTQEINRQTDGP